MTNKADCGLDPMSSCGRVGDNVLVLAGEVDFPMVTEVSAFLGEMAQNKQKECFIHICSPGGVASVGMALFDIIWRAKIHVTTKVYGEACSSAFLIFQAGHHRVMSGLSRIMWHDGWSAIEGRYDSRELEIKRADLKLLDTLGNRAVSWRTGVDVAVVSKWSSNTTWWTAEEAMTDGLADEIEE